MSDALVALSTQVPPHALKFAEELYARDFDAPAAAAAIGRPGLQKELLADRAVQRCIATIGSEMRDQFRDQRQLAVWMLSKMLSFDPKDVAGPGGLAKDPAAWPEEARLCATPVVSKNGEISWRFESRLAILRMFFEIFGDIESANVPSAAAGAVRVIFHGR